uniref:Trypsin-15 n=1 Tax=Nilaparvata lugens TaxID=108931 RepID=A0A068FBA9_NILLU|nr:trypsin-15 [Nilaparvata lugens]
MQFFLALLGMVGLASASLRLPLPMEVIQKHPHLMHEPIHPDARIVYGKPVGAGEAQYQIGLFRSGSFICGGSIINRNTIVTAAHCVYNYESRPNLFKILYGTTDRTSQNNFAEVQSITRHPQYSSNTIDYDVAVIRTAKDLLPSDNAVASAESLKYITTAECQQRWGTVNAITDRMLCTMSTEQSACNGDSGGPLVNKKNGQQIGIVSWGASGCKVGSYPNEIAEKIPQLDDSPQRIINGKPVVAGEIKYQIALLRGGRFICGGSIIRQNAVLTAAHCVFGSENNPTLFSVRYGTTNRENGTTVTVSKINRHPQYNQSTIDYDMAVLKLSQPIQLSANVAPVNLSTVLPTAADDLLLSGWGRNQNWQVPINLQKAETLKVISQAVCQSNWAGTNAITPRMICAKSKDQSACNGDSGGPLVNKKTGQQVGVVSWGSSDCGVNGRPNIYSSVPNLIGWINKMSFFLVLLAALSLASPLTAGERARRLPLPKEIAEKFPDDDVDVPPRIINGRPVATGEIGYQIALLAGGQFICGGSILKSNIVLTAAHCVYGNEDRPSLFSVRYGTINRESGTTVTVGRIIRHPNYNPTTLDYDMAVLKLSQPIQPSANVAAVTLSSTLPTASDSLLLSGWGRNQAGQTPVFLQKADTLKVVSQTVCQANWGGGVSITARMICAVSREQSACNGDSGGPLLNKGTGQLVGVVSWGSRDCSPGGKPNVYASVPNLIGWIQSSSN